VLHFTFFFLRLSAASRNKNGLVPLWTLWSFGEVASWKKIKFRSGLWRALEGLLLGTKLHSALNFIELWRGHFSKQKHVLLWTLEERVLAGNLPPLVVVSLLPCNPQVKSKTLSYNCKRLLFDLIQSGHTMVLDQRAGKRGKPQPGIVIFGPLRAC
jgi:hypothetical protein